MRPSMRLIPTRTDIRIRLAKWYAARHGFAINKGSWIVQNRNSRDYPVCQGWWRFYFKFSRRIWDEINGVHS